MKTLFINLIAICLVTVGFAQTNGNQVEELSGVTVRPINLSYLNAVHDERMPESVAALENRAARYDITTSDVYERDFEAYEVVFEQSNGSIIATYDNRGQIIESLERFKDVTLPYEIRNTIQKLHPGWTIHSDVYLVSYYLDKGVDKVCKVQLRKDGKKKNIKLNLSSINQM